MTQPYIILTIIMSVAATLIARYVWDRYMSKSSRVTVKDHEKDIASLKERLQKGADTFKKISVCMSAICMVQLELCKKLEVDCSDIREIVVNSGLGL